MAFKGIEEANAKRRAEFMAHVSEDVQSRLRSLEKTDTRMGAEEYDGMRLNSYERKLLLPWLSDEALVIAIEYAVKNTLPRHDLQVSSTYDEWIKTDAMSELLKRFKWKVGK